MHSATRLRGPILGLLLACAGPGCTDIEDGDIGEIEQAIAHCSTIDPCTPEAPGGCFENLHVCSLGDAPVCYQSSPTVYYCGDYVPTCDEVDWCAASWDLDCHVGPRACAGDESPTCYDQTTPSCGDPRHDCDSIDWCSSWNRDHCLTGPRSCQEGETPACYDGWSTRLDPYCGDYQELPYDSCQARCGQVAPSGCSCDWDCARRGTCCADAADLCADTVIPATSCAGSCGDPGRAEVCSCDAHCSYFGTCCEDIAGECGEVFDDGMSYVTLLAPQGASVAGKGCEGCTRRASAFLTTDAPAVVGLTKVKIADTDSQGEHSMCSAGCGADRTCAVAAYIDYDDNAAECGGGGIRFPGASWAAADVRGATGMVNAGGLVWSGPNTPTACLGGTAASSIPLLTTVLVEDIDSVGEIGGCSISYVGGSCGWQLTARVDGNDDHDAHCQATILRLSQGMTNLGGWNAEVHTQQGSSNPGTPTPIQYHASKYRSRTEVPMTSDGESVCFLTRVLLEDLDDGSERGGCEIISRNGRWTLAAEVTGWNNDLDADAWCSASCASIPTGSSPGQRGWPGPATAVVDVLGGKATLFQSGGYDQPVLFFEGFDPTNKLGPTSYMRRAAPLFQAMQAVGFDVWVVDFADAGGPVLEIGRQVARAFDAAYKYQGWNVANPGLEIPGIGVSMGALAGRFALSRWEAGVYGSASSAEYIPGLSPTPPVSVFVALVGPQEGANVPLALQTAVMDVGHFHEVGESFYALNAAAAINMMDHHVNPYCRGVVTEWCDAPLGLSWVIGGHGDHTLKNQSQIDVHGNECVVDRGELLDMWGNPTAVTDTCVRRQATGWQCVGQATRHDAFYAQVNGGGPRGNGYPATVYTVGMTTAGWLPQGDQNMNPAYADNGQTPFTTGTRLGELAFRDSGHGFLSFCDRRTRLYPYLGADDLRPGDLSERAFDNLTIDAGSKSHLFIRQYFPMLFVPTASALGCPGATSQAGCEAANRAGAGKFSRIHSTEQRHPADPTRGFNELHGDVDPAMAALILAYLWNGRPGGPADGDLQGEGNPFYSPANPYMWSPETCDLRDSNGDGHIDGTCAGGATSCDASTVVWVQGTGAACDGADADRCAEGVISCTGAGPGTCTDASGDSVETCNGLDDDCDGAIDECVCAEICDGVDNDCNGTVDDGFGVGQGCTTGVGACMDQGLLRCSPDGLTSTCAFYQQGAPGPAAEDCNGVDDDCDGEVDEVAARACTGDTVLCKCSATRQWCTLYGYQTCSSGGWGSCVPAESCGNGRDDDGDCTVDDGCGQSCSCFAAGTEITMADGSTRPIEAIATGDRVMSYDETSGRITAGTVSGTFVHAADGGGLLLVNGKIRTTPNHPFFADGRWLRADQLAVGDQLLELAAATTAAEPARTAAAPVQVTSLVSLADDVTTYNLEVDADHTYFAEGVLVHNKSSCDPLPIQDSVAE